MPKHRKEGPTKDVMVGALYVGARVPENLVGTIVTTEGQDTVLFFDERTVGASIKKLLEPKGALPLSVTDETVQYELPALVDPEAYPPSVNPTLF